jgi:adenylate cyclase
MRHLVELGLLGAAGDAGYTDADVRRVQIVRTLAQSGMPIEQVARLVAGGTLSLDLLDNAISRVFAAQSDTTFAELSARTGIAVETLLGLRVATGGVAAVPSDLVREDELRIVPLVEFQVEMGFQPQAIERALRVYGESLRRIAEAEAEWWRSQIQEPMLAAGGGAGELVRRAGETSPDLSDASDEAVMAIYHAQQMQVWSVNIVNGIAAALEHAGLYERTEQEPAMCFLDVTGYTQLTQERGDAAAAAIVERLNHIVQRIAVQHGGRPVKWLGDGVMLYFPEPYRAVRAALEMVAELGVAGLPPAHVGLDSGPIIVQQGDYYGQTVNLAARIGEYARPGEVLVTREVADAADGPDVRFERIGAVELKGVSGPVDLSVAVRR